MAPSAVPLLTLVRGFGVVIAIGIALVFRTHPRAQTCANAIVCENALPGNPSSEWDIAGAGDSTL